MANQSINENEGIFLRLCGEQLSQEARKNMDEQNDPRHFREEHYYSQPPYSEKDKIVIPRSRLSSQRLLPIFIVITTILLVVVIVFGVVIIHLLTTPQQPSSQSLVSVVQPGITVLPQVGTTPATILPTPTPTPSLPCTVNVGTWTGGSSDWKTLNGMLLNDGTRTMMQGQLGPTIVAPCFIERTADYAVEARIQVVRAGLYSCFGITARGNPTADSWQGYQAIIDGSQGNAKILDAQFANAYSSLAHIPFDPANDWHIYKFEVKGNTMIIVIDGSPLVEVNDNKYLSGGQVGLWSYGVQLNVSSFNVTAL